MTDIEVRLTGMRDRSSDPRDRETLGKAILAVRALDAIQKGDAGCHNCGICASVAVPIEKPPCNQCHGSGDHWAFIGREAFE